MSFSSFGLDDRIVSGLPRTYSTPTPIQTQAIPHVMQGKDVLGLAQTGTGKTAAFVLPILNRLIDRPRGKPRALIIAPTRELAEQICAAIRELGPKLLIRATTIYGGVSMNAQIQQLRRGVDIVVACPGRLLDHIQQRTIDLRALEVLVLDEADHMFDMGFLPTLKRILKTLPATRQTLLFSATMPKEVRGLAMETLKDPETVQVGNRAPVSTVEHVLYGVTQANKTKLLLRLIDQQAEGSVLVFTRTKHRAKKLDESLKEAGHSATSLQGNLSQARRDLALKGFRSGKYRVMVATDIAARGIDVASVKHVVNYDIPDTVEAYTHRIGRTGRAERTGDASTFVTPEDRGMVRSIERTLGSAIPWKQVEGFEAMKPSESDESASMASRPNRRGSYGSRGPRPSAPRSFRPRSGGAGAGADRLGNRPDGRFFNRADGSRSFDDRRERPDHAGQPRANGVRRDDNRSYRPGRSDERSNRSHYAGPRGDSRGGFSPRRGSHPGPRFSRDHRGPRSQGRPYSFSRP